MRTILVGLMGLGILGLTACDPPVVPARKEPWIRPEVAVAVEFARANTTSESQNIGLFLLYWNNRDWLTLDEAKFIAGKCGTEMAGRIVMDYMGTYRIQSGKLNFAPNGTAGAPLGDK